MSFQIPGPSAPPGWMPAGVLRRSRGHGSGQQRSPGRGYQSGHRLMRRDAWRSPTMRRAFTLAALLFGTCRQEVSAGTLQHYEYLFPDQDIYVYDEDDGFRLVDKIDLPGVRGIRGVAVSTSEAMLYISFGGDGGPNWKRVHAQVQPAEKNHRMDEALRHRHRQHGHLSRRQEDSICRPESSLETGSFAEPWTRQSGGCWAIALALLTIVGGQSSIATMATWLAGLREDRVRTTRSSAWTELVSIWAGDLRVLSGRRYGYKSSHSGDRPARRYGWPFTINGAGTLAYTTATRFLGFQVSDITTGGVLYTVRGFGAPFPYDPATFSPSAPSHGISLSPDEKELYVLDAPNSHVHVFDVSGVPAAPPRQVADIEFVDGRGGDGMPLRLRERWLGSAQPGGRFVFVGDSGDVIDTARRAIVANLDPLRNTRKHLEITWQDGVPTSTSTRSGVGMSDKTVRRATAVRWQSAGPEGVPQATLPLGECVRVDRSS